MKVKLSILTGLAVAVLAGCESPQTGVQAMATSPPEQTIPAPAESVRSAAIKTMSARGYLLTPVGADTLLFDREGDLGSTVKFDLLYGKEAWRRVRMRLIPAGAATRVTAEPSLVTNRGSAFEREEADNSADARKAMQDLLGKIRAEVQAGRRG